MGIHSVELLRMSGKISSVEETQQARLLLEKDQALSLCRSPSLNQLVMNALPRGSELLNVPPIPEFPAERMLPFTMDHMLHGMQRLWYPNVDARYVRTDESGATFFLSMSSYWPALLYGVAHALQSRSSSSDASKQVCVYGLQPCLRPEKQVDQWRRRAFVQAHIDFVSWKEDHVTMCRKAIEAISQAVVQFTKLSLQDLRVRVSDARGWTGLLSPHFPPRTVQALRVRLLEPIAGAAALAGADPSLLAQYATRFLCHFSRDLLPDACLRTVSRWIETGDYEWEHGIEVERVHGAEVYELLGLCKAMGIHAMIDARSARDGYSGLTWQIDCKTSKGWIEVAGGGDYSDAALLYGRLHSEVVSDPTLCVVGSAVGVDRALAISSDPRSRP